MNIITSANNTNVVSLKQLIPQHQSLKLLILHTPFNIQISSLSQCLNLVKLDLSKNNIQSFPYLGHLNSLRIMFIHQNHLAINEFIGIFSKGGQQSALCDKIVWVTYWGNKNVFLARHFTVNRTKAIAFDKNMIVDEQKMVILSQDQEQCCFTHSTDISDLFLRRNLISSYTTEEEYMQDFWISLKILRKKYQLLNPIVKIQKTFRGWIFREKLRREFIKERQRYFLLLNCFKEWKGRVGKQRKLARILMSKKKGHLLYAHSKISRQQIYQRMRELGKQARNAVLKRRLLLQNQIKFYSILRNNLLVLQDVYNCLQLSSSPAVYIHKGRINQFMNYVVPFVGNFTKQSINYSLNEYYHMHFLYENNSSSRSQLLKMVKTNFFSIVSYEKPLEKMLQIIKFKKPTHLQLKMKALFGKLHISNEKKEKMAQQERKMEEIKKFEKQQLFKIEGSLQLLKTIARGVVFYNQRRLNLPCSQQDKRIIIFSEVTLRRISSAISIQRAWRGYIFRKKNQTEFKIILKYQKAAIKIQRWFRRLPLLRKKYLLFEAGKKISQFEQPYFLVDFDQYREQIRLQEQRKERQIMVEQYARIYRHKQRGELVMSWDDRVVSPRVKQMMDVKKALFSKVVLRSIINLPDNDLTARMLYSADKLQPVHFSHLFHYQTETALVRKLDRKYIEIKCSSKAQAQFRMFCIILLSFNFKLNRGMQIMRKVNAEGKERVDMGKGEIVVICNESINRVRTVEQCVAKQQNISVYMISNKIFLQFYPNKKPFKLQEKFFIYMIGFVQQTQQNMVKVDINHNGSLLDLRPKQDNIKLRMSTHIDHLSFARERKIIIKKRSIKQFNSKINRRQKKQPNFIIDNKSSDRTHNQSKIQPSTNRQQEEEGKGKGDNKAAHIQQRRKKIFEQRREDQSFTKRFVNLGNFIQNQLMNDQRRRIKTELQQMAEVSFQQVRVSEQNSSTHKKQKLNQKYKKARELQKVHKSLIQHNRMMTEQHGIALRSNVSLNKEQKKNKSQRRKPKVSFAEQSFPIIFNRQRHGSFQ